MKHEAGDTTHGRREWHGAHQPWSYRPEAFRWIGERIVGINFLPLAREVRAWMMRQGKLPLLSTVDQQTAGGYTNPYTFSGVSLALVMGRVINAFHDYGTAPPPDHNEIDAEIERIRLYNEVVLYAARVCEVAIKQLLYCTQVPESRYKRMGLGALLESPCPSCKKQNGRKPHSISWVGSLAHPFHLCLEFDHCAMDHLDLVNKLRNSHAAHSGIQTLDTRSVETSGAELLKDCNEVLTSFLHMLSHVQALEEGMLSDLASKGETITLLKMNGLPAEDCNFNLVPGERFTYPAPSTAKA